MRQGYNWLNKVQYPTVYTHIINLYKNQKLWFSQLAIINDNNDN